MRKGTALVVGATGITGGNLASYLLASGWTVYGLARRPAEQAGVIPVAADLLDETATAQALCRPADHPRLLLHLDSSRQRAGQRRGQ